VSRVLGALKPSPAIFEEKPSEPGGHAALLPRLLRMGKQTCGEL